MVSIAISSVIPIETFEAWQVCTLYRVGEKVVVAFDENLYIGAREEYIGG
jgi:hypothetical protein